MQRILATDVRPIPDWALRQCQLIDVMNEAASVFQERYTRADGSFIWCDEWPGMDGSDDGYESYHNWPLFYALGGDGNLHERSRFLWDAVTRQFADYGQVYQEFDAYYDWMHHGESSIYFYYFGLMQFRPRFDQSLLLTGQRTGKLCDGIDAVGSPKLVVANMEVRNLMRLVDFHVHGHDDSVEA